MKSWKDPKALTVLIVLAAAILVASACSPLPEPATPVLDAKSTFTPKDIWSNLLQQTPYPYTTPLPPADTSALDGTLAKFDPREGTRPFCIRCMPYPAEGGIWKLQLDRGIYRIFSTRSLNGWNSLGSFTVSGDRLTLFNDPHCMYDVGTYTWELEAGQLALQVIEDACADGFRAITFTNYPWESCQPPSAEAAITQHWPAPTGCYAAELSAPE